MTRAVGELAAGNAESAKALYLRAYDAFEAFGLGEGVPSISSEAAVLWVAGGNLERAAELLSVIAGPGLDHIHRDVDWLLTQTALLGVAAAVGDRALVESGLALLEPYAGRAVVDAGAVMFGGVVDDYLFHACTALGRETEAEKWRVRAALAYQRLGARWWLSRVAAPSASQAGSEASAAWHFLEIGSGLWTIGAEGATSTFPNLKGFHYLRQLLRRPGSELTALELAMGPGGRRKRWSTPMSATSSIHRRAMRTVGDFVTWTRSSPKPTRGQTRNGAADWASSARH